MNMNPWERRQKLLEILCQLRHETTNIFAREFNVSSRPLTAKSPKEPHFTAAQSLIELENAGLVERRLIGRNAPYHIYVKLSAGEEET